MDGLVETPEDKARAARIWNALGSLALGYDTGQETTLYVSNQAGQFQIDAASGSAPQGRTAAPATVATVAGFNLTIGHLLFFGAAAYLLMRR